MVLPASRTLQPESPPIAPTEEEWRAMSAAQRERFVLTVLDALSGSQS
jgi:hypothetical protein